MLIEGGYLKNTPFSGYFYPVRDFKINPTGWNRIIIKKNKDTINDTFEYTIFNINKLFNLKLSQNNDYTIGLYLNGKQIYSQSQLYEYYLDIDIDSNDNKTVEFVEGIIVDH